MSEPIGVRPGTYPVPGQKEPVMGLCIVLDDAEAKWEVIEDPTDYSITIKIPPTSPWRVNRAEDKDEPGSFYLQVFRKGAKINSIVLNSFIHPTNEVHTPNADSPEDAPPELKIHYTNPANEVYEAPTVARARVK